MEFTERPRALCVFIHFINMILLAMYKRILSRTTAITLLLLLVSSASAEESRWGADYFPNVILTSHEGDTFSFFDDLIKDKVVVINFIYTTCPDVCPLETAQLTRVQSIMGDRLGKDVFFYSITIDPDVDTPEVLKEYRNKFGAKWQFFTGDEQQIVTLRRKLGLYIEDIEGGENNHNVNMIMGNQTTGRWMRRSPFENPYVLADQIGNWLHGWKSPQLGNDYTNAPDLRNISPGEQLFRTRCVSCHTVDGSADTTIGPDLLAVTQRRDRTWLINWLRNPDKMLEEQDPIAIEMYNRFNQIPMPNMSLTQVDVMDVLKYIEEESEKVLDVNRPAIESVAKPTRFKPGSDIVAVMNAWVREALPGSKTNAGYMTLINVGHNELKVTSVDSGIFGEVQIHNMTRVDGLMKMQKIDELVIPVGDQVVLKPGGMHLMLMQPQRDVVKGETVGMILNFASGRSQSMTVIVSDK